MKNICVYCGSSGHVDDVFKTAAKETGLLLAENGIRIVYGGGHVGLMGMVADSAITGGGEVTGIIPEHIAEKEVAHAGLTELHVVKTMHERKQRMVDYSDAFLILPGGLGTLDEFFEIFTWWQLGLHDKPIIIVNINDYWTPLLDLIDNIIAHKFAQPSDRDFISVVNKVEDIMQALARAPEENKDVKTKWM